jgi:hypothetical protein
MDENSTSYKISRNKEKINSVVDIKNDGASSDM